jgi:hypothetical protein
MTNESDEDIDNVNEKLDLFMARDAQAKKNWHKIKFRLQVIAQFQSLSTWMMLEEEPEPMVEEIKKKNELPWYIIRENGLTKKLFDVLTNMFYVASFFLTCFTLAFGMQPLEISGRIEVVIDIIILLDITTQFVTTRTVRGELVSNPTNLAQMYIKGAFFWDAIACLPGLFTMERFVYAYPLKLFRVFNLSRTFEQIDHLVNYMKQRYMQKSIQISNYYIFSITIFKMVIVFHIFACCWINIGDTEEGWRK